MHKSIASKFHSWFHAVRFWSDLFHFFSFLWVGIYFIEYLHFYHHNKYLIQIPQTFVSNILKWYWLLNHLGSAENMEPSIRTRSRKRKVSTVSPQKMRQATQMCCFFIVKRKILKCSPWRPEYVKTIHMSGISIPIAT